LAIGAQRDVIRLDITQMGRALMKSAINLLRAFVISACFQRAMLGLSEMKTISVSGSRA